MARKLTQKDKILKCYRQGMRGNKVIARATGSNPCTVSKVLNANIPDLERLGPSGEKKCYLPTQAEIKRGCEEARRLAPREKVGAGRVPVLVDSVSQSKRRNGLWMYKGGVS